MAQKIFAEWAHKYWHLGLPVMPVMGKEPAPGMRGWNGLLAADPSESKKAAWLERHAEAGIGLLLGREVVPCYRLVAIDADDSRYDRLVPGLVMAANSANSPVLCGKRGAKGPTIFALVAAEEKFRSTALKAAKGFGGIDILAAGKYTVMPPSIHPVTQRPYEVLGQDLLEVAKSTLPLVTPHLVKVLGTAIKSEHLGVIVSGTHTHDSGVAFTAELVAAQATDEEIRAIVEGLLPVDYAGDSLQQLQEWIDSARAKGFDFSGDARPNLTALIVTIVLAEGVELFNDGETAYASVPAGTGTVAYRVLSSGFRRCVRHIVHKALDRPVGSTAIADSIANLEAMALFDGPAKPIYVRIAGDMTVMEIDLGAKDGRVVRIEPGAWNVVGAATFKFVTGAGALPLPTPVRGGSLRKLQTFLGLDETNFRLLIAFLLNALKPTGPYFILMVEGARGSGKSVFCEVIKRIVDPNKAMRTRLPDNDKDLMIQAKEFRVLSFDNASGMRPAISDSLCTVATGGAIAVRRLYSDDELHMVSAIRPFVINGIAGFATRPDLIDRGIPINLPALTEERRKTEDELFAEFDAILPEILGALYDALAEALKRYPETPPPRHLRMADAARLIAAAEAAVGEVPGALVEAIADAQDGFLIDRVNDEPLMMRLRSLTLKREFNDYVMTLFRELDEPYVKGLPRTASGLSKQLRYLAPAMAKAGIHVEFLPKDKRGRRVRIWSDPDVKMPPTA